ncbi:response regulator [Virgibacillus alimentarius]|uniref:Two-component system response regulator (Stage 0 sporulation protein F) n=1 Tax=Virgibacillus alimentarius TaxID=698769 RepID=A0ABS4SC67_9BACI|nr:MULTISPECIES: response regulator [Virgibacillus]MBP2257992.1 two-component system response regulator (stage 0 sporulation protein F) [Virgibacillus alimentarius]HLR67261.1 response regulator [Virgibacillus sp.]
MQREILIVDDQPGIRLLLTDVFENEGYKVHTAETGKETLDTLAKKHFDLVILDYRLPIINGIEVLNRMEQDNMQVPVMLMSGLVEEMDRETDKYHLLKGVLAKPFDIKAVVEKVKSIFT